MIFVKRTEEPKTLKENKAQWSRDIKVAQKKMDSASLERAINKYRQKNIKNALRKMFNDKCAYCESKVSHVEYGHIEHFKPKSIFPEEAVFWDNLLLSCAICNGAEYKGDKFPDAAHGGFLINPCIEDPGEYLVFEFDEKALSANVLGKTVRGTTTVSLLGLNREELRKYRSERVKTLIVLAHYYHSDPEACKLLDEAIKESGEFAAFARMVKEKYVAKKTDQK